MATSPGNSINETTTGITGFTGTAFTGTAATQYNVLVGGSTSSTLSNVAPSATSGVPLISQGASANPIFGTTAIAGGGTNATSMSTSNGIVKYDGTSLVTSSSATIDSSNRMRNTAQPAFYAYNSVQDDNVTGDNTNYTVICDTEVTDQGSNYNNGSGVFTAPVTGLYLFTAGVTVLQLGVLFTGGGISFLATGQTVLISSFNVGLIRDPGNNYVFNGSAFIPMTANDTCVLRVLVSGSTKTVDVAGGIGTTFFSGCLIC